MRVSSANVTKLEMCNLDLNFELVKTAEHWRTVCGELQEMFAQHWAVEVCAQNSYICAQELLQVQIVLMCAQSAEVCTELKHESVTAVKPRKSKRGFSHAVAHNMRRTRIRIKGNEPIFDISPSIKMSTFSYDSSFSPAGLLLHNGNKPLPLGTVTLLPSKR